MLDGRRPAAGAIGVIAAVMVALAVVAIADDAGPGSSAQIDAGLVARRTSAGDADGGALQATDAANAPTPRRSSRGRRDAGLADAPVDEPIDAVELDAPGPIDAAIDAPDAAREANEAGERALPMPTPEEMQTALDERAPDAPVIEAQPEGAPASAETTVFTLKLIFGLAMLLALAYLGGHPQVLRMQERLGLRGVVVAGFPFVALGVVASLPAVSILSDEVIPKLRPVLQFGLGWIGFIIGAHLDIRVLDRLPRGSAYLILIEALAPAALTAAACGALMIGLFGLPPEDPATWRDVILIGTAAAMTAPRRFRGLANREWRSGRGADVLLGQLDEIAGVVGLLFLTAYFRQDDMSAWELPGTAWLFVAVGLGVVLGTLILATVRLPRSNAEFLAIVLGVIAFASGLASVLRLSPVVICFLAGTLITNFPNEQRANVFAILNRLERPIHLLFLMIAGALWNVSDWRGWILVPVFVIARIVGKWLGIATSRMTLSSVLPAEFTERRQLVVPMSIMALALVISLERFRDLGMSWVVTAVIGAAVAFEVLTPRSDDAAPTTRDSSGPIDELDDGEPPPREPDEGKRT